VTPRQSLLLRACLALAASLPALWLLWAALVRHDLGADPVKTLQVVTGLSCLNLLFATLAVTPLRRLLGWNFLARQRRMLGLFAYAYAILHLLIYVVFDQSLSLQLIWDDTVEHPRIAVGALAVLLLTPLAVTSTDGMIRRLGRWWRRVHRLIYPAAALGVIHYLMVQKLDIREGLVFAGIFAGLMLARVAAPVRK
jgi:sulfoxide reductase heme-binding subunit YedZ